MHKVGWHEHRFVGGMAIVSQRKKHHLRVFFCFTASETPSVFFCFTALVISTGGSVSGTVLRAHNLHNKITFRVTESIKKAASHSTICHIALRGHAERARLTQTLDTANIHRQTFTGQTFTAHPLLDKHSPQRCNDRHNTEAMRDRLYKRCETAYNLLCNMMTFDDKATTSGSDTSPSWLTLANCTGAQWA